MNFSSRRSRRRSNATLDVAGDPVAEALVLGLDLAVRGEDLGEPVLGQAGPLVCLLGGARLLERLQCRLGRGRRVARVGCGRTVGLVGRILAQGIPPPRLSGL